MTPTWATTSPALVRYSGYAIQTRASTNFSTLPVCAAANSIRSPPRHRFSTDRNGRSIHVAVVLGFSLGLRIRERLLNGQDRDDKCDEDDPVRK